MEMPVNDSSQTKEKRKKHTSVNAFSQAKLEIAMKSLENIDLNVIRKKKA